MELVENIDFVNKHKTEEKHFSRNRVWNFKNSFLFIASMLNKRCQTEIDNFLSKVFEVPEGKRVSTASAFTQCRDKIRFTAFQDATDLLVNYFYRNFRHKTYHGYRLIAIDGSVYTLPKTQETIDDFGENILSPNGKWVKSKVSFATDVLNNICIKATIGAYKDSEREHAERLIKELGDCNLYIFDRGYFGKNLLKLLSETQNHYCFRVTSNASREVIDFIKSDKTDVIQTIKVENMEIKVRLTKVALDSGETEYLLTSLLSEEQFSVKKLKALYHLRWGVEEQYKDMKHALGCENFVGKKTNSIKQEFFANILTYNLSMMTFKPIIDKVKKKGKHKYQTNKRALLAKLKQCYVRLLYSAQKHYETIEYIIESVASESVPIRLGRKYPRGKSEKVKIKTFRAYVPVI